MPMASADPDPTPVSLSQPPLSGRAKNPALYRAGRWLAIAGITVFLPLLATAALSSTWRLEAAYGTLGAWIVWKIGRALMKLNDPAS